MAQDKLKLAVFISGRGSNLKAILDACDAPDFPARVELVVSNIPDAFGLTYASSRNIPALIVPHKAYAGRAAFEEALLNDIAPYKPDLICLAGFMRLLSPVFIKQYEGRIINIHPSLLPAHKGLDTHRRVLEAGDAQTGCTVHIVTPEMDEGPVLVQRAVDVLADDTEQTLAARVLEQEHIAYKAAIEEMADRLIHKR